MLCRWIFPSLTTTFDANCQHKLSEVWNAAAAAAAGGAEAEAAAAEQTKQQPELEIGNSFLFIFFFGGTYACF